MTDSLKHHNPLNFAGCYEAKVHLKFGGGWARPGHSWTTTTKILSITVSVCSYADIYFLFKTMKFHGICGNQQLAALFSFVLL